MIVGRTKMSRFFKMFGLFLLFLMFKVNVYADDISVTECEYTEQYKRWLTLSEEERSNVYEPVKCKSDSAFFF